jgi:hypothetical protein
MTVIDGALTAEQSQVQVGTLYYPDRTSNGHGWIISMRKLLLSAADNLPLQLLQTLDSGLPMNRSLFAFVGFTIGVHCYLGITKPTMSL